MRGGYQLTILAPERHRALFTPILQDRISAAKSGRSHDFSGSFAHVLVLNRCCESLVPFVVLSDARGFKTSGQLVGKRAVIIENQENFYCYRAFLTALDQPDLAESCDILLGSGNQICHRLNHRFLAEYEVIYCAQDLDSGGLSIYQSLKKSLPQCHWLAPPDWDLHRDKFRLAPKSADQLAKAIKLARELGLTQEADLMNQTRAFLEQEAFLPALPQD
ncbi:Wadjet anti-phage system protein JetD domain-containing protein [Photobacterium halotolerans]|uniref:Wadjet anti-phage system protein JetD domain-containing protein n=1 Tax=Photobacterium halotolerans TaxID=265726 RepID=UPI003075E709